MREIQNSMKESPTVKKRLDEDIKMIDQADNQFEVLFIFEHRLQWFKDIRAVVKEDIKLMEGGKN